MNAYLETVVFLYAMLVEQKGYTKNNGNIFVRKILYYYSVNYKRESVLNAFDN